MFFAFCFLKSCMCSVCWQFFSDQLSFLSICVGHRRPMGQDKCCHIPHRKKGQLKSSPTTTSQPKRSPTRWLPLTSSLVDFDVNTAASPIPAGEIITIISTCIKSAIGAWRNNITARLRSKLQLFPPPSVAANILHSKVKQIYTPQCFFFWCVYFNWLLLKPICIETHFDHEDRSQHLRGFIKWKRFMPINF